jgi:hypothetical protein
MVLAVTGTNIGVDISQNPATQSPQAKLGYQRTELAIVPTNRSTQADPFSTNAGKDSASHGGAKDVANVIMELRYGGIFDTGPSSGIYQRLAVGTEAVRQPGASLMFAKDVDGKISNDTANALKALESVPKTLTLDALDCLSQNRRDNTKRAAIDAAVKKTQNNMTWEEFVLSNPSETSMNTLLDELKPTVECKP